jgi:hypothetical protein
MVRAIEGDKALRVPRGDEDLSGVVDPDDVVLWRVEYEQGLLQPSDPLDIEGSGNIRRVKGRSDSRHANHLRNASRGREHCSAASAVTDEQGWRAMACAKGVCRRDEIVHIASEVGVFELPVAFSEAREVEPEGCDPLFR